ncbi:DMT family transporter [Kaistia terrae]|uniref:DMT family transporter n=1 Tax=Kaistia terrae TaxID=537017 RepID=A0ABW0PT22_9HYPH|nr:DMT family transporter [Kaistia terrae]MCX5577211.1 DMT family transporter [Kaistia terrae]
MPALADNSRGIIMMVLSNLAFMINDTWIKLASDGLPTGQILFIRGIFAFALILVLVFATGTHRQWRAACDKLLAWRTVGEIGATVLYLYALFNMPIANVSAIGQIVPLMTTAAAAVFLAEPVGWRRWTAIAVGFFGVMLIMRPSVSGFDIYSLAALASMGFITLRDLVTREFKPGMPTLLVIAVTAAAVMTTGAAMSVTEVWPEPEIWQWMLLAAAAVLLVGGYGASILAMRYGAMAVVAPFRYSGILFAVVLGYMVWGDVPDALTLVGTLIVVATGVYTFKREMRLAQKPANASEPVAINPSSV